MRKYILLFRPEYPESHSSFAERIGKKLSTVAFDNRITDLRMSYTTGKCPPSLLPLREGPVVCVSLRCKADGPELLGDLGLTLIEGFVEAYEADEALPVSYTREWTAGETTPGVCLLTLFHRKRAIDYETFITRWHQGHTALSLRFHPLWHYNRNVVCRIDEAAMGVSSSAGPGAGGAGPGPVGATGAGKTPGGPAPTARNQPYDGIVEEHFRLRKDLLNPFRFYGRPHIIIPRMIRILIDILGFIDLRRIETYLVRETIIKSAR